ncbi:glutaredoxin family protein [Macrococcus animalis]|uniref:glutaredoxin family protein n=1 Tax=Macrococcus animalis TaxID=3395467 RepID=UPI0039BE5CF4
MYTQDACPPCEFIKQYFNQKDISFTEKNINHMPYKIEMIDYNAMSTPLIKIDNQLFYTPDIEAIETYMVQHDA